MKEFLKKNALYGAFAVALIAFVGSMYYSQILHLPPCVLCWYQRICIFPLFVILGVSIFKKSRDIIIPAFILAIVGWIISLYHNLLYFEILPEAAAPCMAGISCSTKFEGWLALFPIPLQALVGLTVILIALTIYWKSSKNTESQINNV